MSTLHLHLNRQQEVQSQYPTALRPHSPAPESSSPDSPSNYFPSSSSLSSTLDSYGESTTSSRLLGSEIKESHSCRIGDRWPWQWSSAVSVSSCVFHLFSIITISVIFIYTIKQIRSIYRTIELSEGYLGHLATTEAFFYGLDTLPLFIAIAIYVPFWPGRYVPDLEELKALEEKWKSEGEVDEEKGTGVNEVRNVEGEGEKARAEASQASSS